MAGCDNYCHAVGTQDFRNPTGELKEQMVYFLKEHTNNELKRFVDKVKANRHWHSTVFIFISDHGLVGVYHDDEHSLLREWEEQKEIEAVFNQVEFLTGKTWGTAGKRKFVKGSKVVYSPSIGLSHIYLVGHDGKWKNPPTYGLITKLAMKLYDAATEGKYCDEMKNSLGDPPAILVRMEQEDWGEGNENYRKTLGSKDYKWLKKVSGDYYLLSISELVAERGANWCDIEKRINGELRSDRSGDIILLFDIENGYYSDRPERGEHGGPTKFEAEVPLVYAFQGDLQFIKDAIAQAKASNPDIEGTVKLLTWSIVEILKAVQPSQ